jgi:hypothetical protein
MHADFKHRQGGMLGKIDDGATAAVPAAAEQPRASAFQIGVVATRQSPGVDQAAIP